MIKYQFELIFKNWKQFMTTSHVEPALQSNQKSSIVSNDYETSRAHMKAIDMSAVFQDRHIDNATTLETGRIVDKMAEQAIETSRSMPFQVKIDQRDMTGGSAEVTHDSFSIKKPPLGDESFVRHGDVSGESRSREMTKAEHQNYIVQMSQRLCDLPMSIFDPAVAQKEKKRKICKQADMKCKDAAVLEQLEQRAMPPIMKRNVLLRSQQKKLRASYIREVCADPKIKEAFLKGGAYDKFVSSKNEDEKTKKNNEDSVFLIVVDKEHFEKKDDDREKKLLMSPRPKKKKIDRRGSQGSNLSTQRPTDVSVENIKVCKKDHLGLLSSKIPFSFCFGDQQMSDRNQVKAISGAFFTQMAAEVHKSDEWRQLADTLRTEKGGATGGSTSRRDPLAESSLIESHLRSNMYESVVRTSDGRNGSIGRVSPRINIKNYMRSTGNQKSERRQFINQLMNEQRIVKDCKLTNRAQPQSQISAISNSAADESPLTQLETQRVSACSEHRAMETKRRPDSSLHLQSINVPLDTTRSGQGTVNVLDESGAPLPMQEQIKQQLTTFTSDGTQDMAYKTRNSSLLAHRSPGAEAALSTLKTFNLRLKVNQKQHLYEVKKKLQNPVRQELEKSLNVARLAEKRELARHVCKFTVGAVNPPRVSIDQTPPVLALMKTGSMSKSPKEASNIVASRESVHMPEVPKEPSSTIVDLDQTASFGPESTAQDGGILLIKGKYEELIFRDKKVKMVSTGQGQSDRSDTAPLSCTSDKTRNMSIDRAESLRYKRNLMDMGLYRSYHLRDLQQMYEAANQLETFVDRTNETALVEASGSTLGIKGKRLLTYMTSAEREKLSSQVTSRSPERASNGQQVSCLSKIQMDMPTKPYNEPEAQTKSASKSVLRARDPKEADSKDDDLLSKDDAMEQMDDIVNLKKIDAYGKAADREIDTGEVTRRVRHKTDANVGDLSPQSVTSKPSDGGVLAFDYQHEEWQMTLASKALEEVKFDGKRILIQKNGAALRASLQPSPEPGDNSGLPGRRAPSSSLRQRAEYVGVTLGTHSAEGTEIAATARQGTARVNIVTKKSKTPQAFSHPSEDEDSNAVHNIDHNIPLDGPSKLHSKVKSVVAEDGTLEAPKMSGSNEDKDEVNLKSPRLRTNDNIRVNQDPNQFMTSTDSAPAPTMEHHSDAVDSPKSTVNARLSQEEKQKFERVQRKKRHAEILARQLPHGLNCSRIDRCAQRIFGAQIFNDFSRIERENFHSNNLSPRAILPHKTVQGVNIGKRGSAGSGFMSKRVAPLYQTLDVTDWKQMIGTLPTITTSDIRVLPATFHGQAELQRTIDAVNRGRKREAPEPRFAMSLDMTANQLKRMTLLTPPAGSLQFAPHEYTVTRCPEGALPNDVQLGPGGGSLLMAGSGNQRAALMTAVGNTRSFASPNYSRWHASTDKHTLSSATPQTQYQMTRPCGDETSKRGHDTTKMHRVTREATGFEHLYQRTREQSRREKQRRSSSIKWQGTSNLSSNAPPLPENMADKVRMQQNINEDINVVTQTSSQGNNYGRKLPMPSRKPLIQNVTPNFQQSFRSSALTNQLRTPGGKESSALTRYEAVQINANELVQEQLRCFRRSLQFEKEAQTLTKFAATSLERSPPNNMPSSVRRMKRLRGRIAGSHARPSVSFNEDELRPMGRALAATKQS